MSTISIVGDNITSPLGWTTEENVSALLNDRTGLQKLYSQRLKLNHTSGILSEDSIDLRFSKFHDPQEFTKLEKAGILSIREALNQNAIDPSPDTVLFVIATTKGNITLLNKNYKPGIDRQRRFLHTMACTISRFFGNRNNPMVISNACISGLVGLIGAKRLLESGHYDYIIVLGCDEVNDFTLTGFNALKALSDDFCKPFDQERKGINLGDACGTIILSRAETGLDIELAGGSITNDANHISGPSRTGEGMYQAINSSLASLDPPETIEYISAHGTATTFNDDMESKALNRLGLSEVPVNSFKGFWGHTLGAAGIIESIATYHSILSSSLIASKGFNTLGTECTINVIKESSKQSIKCALKTSSGFGGCNAAIIFKRR